MTPSKTSIPTLTVLEPLGKNEKGKNICRYRCSCGTEFIAVISNVESGNTRSCGCYGKRRAREVNTKHGAAVGGKITPEYRTWIHMRQRCYRPEDISYPIYGGRGITVHKSWRNSFTQFLSDMGPKPTPKHTLERRDNNAAYGPKNCYWATYSQQARNRRNSIFVTIRGVRMPLIEACEKYDVSYKNAHQRLTKHKWSVERTFGVGK